jgi:hypothetical protein
MSRAKQASKRKRRSKAVPVLGAAGLSLALASGASAATGGPAADMLTRNTGVCHEITLGEEEIFEVSLATFYVLDKEYAGAFRPGVKLAMGGGCGCGGCGCWTGTDYGASTLWSEPRQHSIKLTHKYTHARERTHIPKNP